MADTAKKTETKKNVADRDKLIADLKTLIEDARALTGDAVDTSQEFFAEKVAETQDKLKDAVTRLKEHGEVAQEKGKEGVEAVEDYIKSNPWKSLGIALVAGVVLDRLFRD